MPGVAFSCAHHPIGCLRFGLRGKALKDTGVVGSPQKPWRLCGLAALALKNVANGQHANAPRNRTSAVVGVADEGRS
jgi:hypothetical protein